MPEDFISLREHEEFIRRMSSERERLEDEDRRQNKRLDVLEETVKQFSAISTSVEKLALNMENMLVELKAQGERLKTLESRDGEMWRKALSHIMTTIIGIVLGLVFTRLGM